MPRVGSANRAFRMEDLGLWERFGEVAQPDRSAVLRDFIRWYVRDPGATMPRRPEIPQTATEDH